MGRLVGGSELLISARNIRANPATAGSGDETDSPSPSPSVFPKSNAGNEEGEGEGEGDNASQCGIPGIRMSELAELGDKFEDIEHEQFGKDGFEQAVAQIAEIEKSLGLADLAQFTAQPPPRA